MSGIQLAFQSQNKAVYDITEEQLMAGLFATPVCHQVVAFINCHVSEANSLIDKFNAARFSSEVADRFVDVLLNHIKRLTITQSGGLLLMQDMTEFRDCAMRTCATTKRAELLTDIARICMVEVSQLKAVQQDSSLHMLDPSEFRALVNARADCRSSASPFTKLVVKVKNAT